MKAFPGRFDVEIKNPITKAEAKEFWDISAKRFKKGHVVERYNLARRHLNRLEPLAFAYVHDVAEPEVLAASICPVMVRSNFYFQELIQVFGENLGPAQGWQVIPRAVKSMERDYGSNCEKLFESSTKNNMSKLRP